MKTKNLVLTAIAMMVFASTWAFCGFYVAKADATLFNNKSEVILVRDGEYTVITMGSDFKGDVKDFAMVVPVPVVLARQDISIVDRGIFDRLDAYSSPRLAEYYDYNPCQQQVVEEKYLSYPASVDMDESDNMRVKSLTKKEYGVTIEAQYTVGEYDILLLSATESNGLKNWLTDNGYKIPEKAERVLAPYIKSNMKFFVVKVNLEEMKKAGFDQLRPIQVRFNHPKFMLPLRLGMANSAGSQDMIVYAFTRTGRVECTNYRTVKLPTDRNVPLSVKKDFGPFYKRLFENQWQREGKNVVFLEYAWNVTPSWGGMKCDPCVGPPPINQDFTMAGVNWYQWNAPTNIFFTRMHVRYDEAHFPADLQFQVTPNTEHYQARYVVTNPAPVYDGFDCTAGQDYLFSLHNKRKLELDEYYALCGAYMRGSQDYMTEYDRYLKTLPEEWREPVYENAPNGEIKKGDINPIIAIPSAVHEVLNEESKRESLIYFMMLVGLVVAVVWKSNKMKI
jgi:hypothetical protein